MAGRIPQSFIQELLARTDIVQVIGERLQLKKAGREYMALSPFSNEKSPSFTVSPQKQFYHCFSSGKHGTAITFLMEYDRLNFVEAVEELAKRAGLQVPREGGSAAPALVLDGPLDALAAAERFYKSELKKSTLAVEYLKKRGVTGETAKRFGLGYAPESWDALARQFSNPKHALEAGLLIQREGRDGHPRDSAGARGVYDRFRHRVMFPIRDTRGRTIGFGGRTLGDDKAKYLNSPETVLFHKGRNLYGLFEARAGTGAIPYLLVVEGYMDAVMLAQHGITHVVATLGTATTREHLALMFKTTSKVVFCFDGDRAGRSAAWRALEQALPEVHEGRECTFMFLPEGQDPDSLVQQIGADEFRRRVQEAQPLSAFLIGELSRQVPLSSPEGRARLASLARPHLARMREGGLRSLIVDELTRLTRLSRAELGAVMSAAGPADSAPTILDSVSARPVRRALQLLMERPALAQSVDDLDSLARADTPGADLLVQVIEFFQERPGANAGQLLESWRDDERGPLVDAIAASRLELEDGAMDGEFGAAIAHLLHKARQGRAHELLARARERELSAGESAELDRLVRELKAPRAPESGP